jgi:cell division protein FtsW
VNFSAIAPPVGSVRRDLSAPRRSDPILVATTVGLVILSVIMVYSTTGILAQEKFGNSLFFFKRQVVAALVGGVLAVIASRLDLGLLRRISPYLFFVSVGLVMLTLIPGLGDRAGGAQRWVQLPFLRFQPVEFIKIMFVIFLAGYFARNEGSIGDVINGVLKPFLLLGCIAVPLLMQPDFGSTAVMAVVTFGIAVSLGVKLRWILVGLIAAGGLAAILVAVSPYRMMRIVSFLSPTADSSGKGYQLIQSLIAVGTGELTGVGLGGSQQKLFFLPAAHTDFIFAVIAEELGFVGCLGVIVAFLVFLWRGLLLASRLADDTFACGLAVGLTLLIVAPAFLNMGVVLGLLPTKGMVLPLVGYGGSSLISSLFGVGLLLALSRSFQSNVR